MPRPPVDRVPSTGNLDFDALEDKIRGEELFLKEGLQKAKAERELKKKMDDQEIERRLKELRQKIEGKKTR
jgi:hypothetical protein